MPAIGSAAPLLTESNKAGLTYTTNYHCSSHSRYAAFSYSGIISG
jgi:hypothetical protein